VGDVGATQDFVGAYLATGSYSSTEQTSSDAGVDACGTLPSTPWAVSWGYTVSRSADASTVLITDETLRCSFSAHEDGPGVFSATDANCLPLPNSSLTILGFSLIYHYLTLDVPGGTLRGLRISYWYNPLHGDLMMCTSFDLRLSS
jgi:hypothetical protein